MLQQLRAGYPRRPGRFPQSVVLCGLRDVRDYRMGAAGSPFNIVAASLRRTCFGNKALRADRSRAVTAADVAAVREQLIVDRVTHLDYLADKLREERVRRVIEPMLGGGARRASARDVEYARDLGLIAQEGRARVANPIYAEVIQRELAQDELEAWGT